MPDTAAHTNAPLSPHAYDGIQEYDNPTPGWWHAIFFATILFSLGYFLIYNLDPDAKTIQDDLAVDQAREYQRLFAEVGDLKPDAPTMQKMMADPKWMLFAASSFRNRCASCHGPDGGGIIGPNLTDDSYKNIKVMTDIPSVITNGAAAGAMPAQRNTISENEIVLLGSYVATLRGKNLPGRAPEGEKIPPWPAPTK